MSVRRVCHGLLALFTIVNMNSVRAFAQDALPESSPQSATSDPAVKAALRGDLLRFAPLVSLRNKFTLGEYSPTDVATVLETWTKDREQERGFNSHPSLEAAYRDYRAFLVASHQRVTPLLKSLTLQSAILNDIAYSEANIAAAFLAAAAQVKKDLVLFEWYSQHDQKCQDAFRRIFPLLRSTSTATPLSDGAINARHWFTRDKGVFLEAINDTGRALRNVSLKVVWETLDGRTLEHYYFLSEWPAARKESDAHRFFLRPAAQWWDVGADATTALTIEMLSDESTVQRQRVRLDDQVPTAADQIIAELTLAQKEWRQPKIAIDRLTKIKPQLVRYKDREEAVEALLKTAKEQLETATEAIDKKLKEDKASLKDQQSKSYTQSWQEKTRKEQIEKLKESIKTLEARRQRWMRGEETPSDRQRHANPYSPVVLPGKTR
jgi:hypothetical protein